MIDQSILKHHNKQVVDVVRFLDSSHLPPERRKIVQHFEDCAAEILREVPSSPFLTVAMRALVSAKNEAVLAAIHAEENHIYFERPAKRSDTPDNPAKWSGANPTSGDKF